MDDRRAAAGAGDVHERVGLRLAERDVRQPGRRSPRARRTSRPTSRRTGTTRSPAAASRRAVDNGPLHALANATSAERRLRLRRGRHVPANTFNAGNYWVDVLFAGSRRAGPGHERHRDGRAGSATVSWTAPPAAARPTSYKITPYIGATAQTPKTITGTPPATSTNVHGPHARHGVHVHGAGDQPRRRGPESAPSNPVTPLGVERAGRADRRRPRRPTRSPRSVSWTRAGERRRQRDHRLHVTPFVGAPRRRPSTSAARHAHARHRPHQRHELHVHGRRRRTPPARARRRRRRTPSPRRRRSSSSPRPRVRRRGRRQLGRARRQVHAPTSSGSITGIRFYKAAANTGTHVGSAVDRPAARLLRQGDVHGRDRRRAGRRVTFATPGGDHGGHDVRRHLPGAERALLGRPARRSRPTARRQPAAARARRRDERERRVRLQRHRSAFPSSSWNATNYWVDVLFAAGVR